MRTRKGLWVCLALACGNVASAQSTSPTTSSTDLSITRIPTTQQEPSTSPSAVPTTQLGNVVVTSDLDLEREQIAPSLGATTYTQGPSQIQTIPGGQNTSFQHVLLRMPGVVQDSFGQEHVRGEHANLTYRVNGVLLPQPISEFGQELDTGLVDSVTLITGALPAQFGFHTAGIIDVTTKSGATLNHNEVSVYGGSYDTIQPSVQVGGSSGKWDYFFVGSYNHNGLGIENPTDSYSPIHDDTDQQKFFGYMSYQLDETSRLTFLLNSANADFQIPNTPGLPTQFTLNGVSTADSAKIDENQNEQEHYAVVSYQKSQDKASYQLSLFGRYGQITFEPDVQRDLIFQGVSSNVYNSYTTGGLQFDSSYLVNDEHTVRAGLLADYTYERLNTNTGVFPVDPVTGNQSSDVPTFISDNTNNQATESGVYLQDEWRLNSKWTLNYGLRYDRFDASFDTEDQVSPCANLVWKIDQKNTAHVGYARYFVPPPVQNVTTSTIDKFAGTTNAPENFLADPPKVERSHYFDIGLTHKLNPAWQVGVDGFYKIATNLVDLGQFGAALIETPFNYAHARVYGAELSTTYKKNGWSAFANVGWVETRAHDINSQQFQIDNAELAYISNHDIKLDHEAEFAGSAGIAYEWKNDRVYVDILAATGLRSGFANTGQVEPHYPVNVGWEHIFRLGGPNANRIRLRFDVVNVFDQKYQIRDGSGIGVGAPQYGQRLSFYGGLTYEF